MLDQNFTKIKINNKYVKNNLSPPEKSITHCNYSSFSKENIQKASRIIFSAVFLLLICLPCLFKLAGIKLTQQTVKENRVLQDRPRGIPASWSQYFRTWDTYFNDRLGLREVCLPAYIAVWERLLEAQVAEFVTGKNGELYMNHAVSIVGNALGLHPISTGERADIRVGVAGRHAFFFAQDIPYYLFLAPDKTTLYPHLLPWYAELIKHEGWYQQKERELKKAHINFYSLKEYLAPFVKDRRLFDHTWDTDHWNGNALALAYPYMAGILARDNPIFEPVTAPDYYDVTIEDKYFFPYGWDKSPYITLKKMDNITCFEPSQDMQSWRYNKTCINKSKTKGSLLFFSDSYFGGTHGSESVTPFVHNVRLYNHRHYFQNQGDTTWSFLERSVKEYHPDAVIEEIVERQGVQYTYEPIFRILGDTWLGNDGWTLDPAFSPDDCLLSGCTLQNDAGNDALLLASSDSKAELTLKRTVTADDFGRIALMMNVAVSEDTQARLYWTKPGEEFSQQKSSAFQLKKGGNLISQVIWLAPHEKVQLRFSPGVKQNSTCLFNRIPYLDALRARMKARGL